MVNLVPRRCSACGVECAASPRYFPRDAASPCGVRYTCRACSGVRSRATYAADPEPGRDSSRRWRSDPAHREHNRVASLQYRHAHIDQCRENSLRWNRDHREAFNLACRAAQHKRRLRKTGGNGSHTKADIEAQYARQRGRCYWCGTPTRKNYHIDHVIPLSRGGSNGPENIVVACPPCNYQKHDKLPHEFDAQRAQLTLT